MGRIFRWTEQFQHFMEEVKESFWGDLYGQTKLAWKEFLEEQSRKERDRSVGVEDYERAGEKRRGYRNGFYVRDFVTRLGTLRLRVARSRGDVQTETFFSRDSAHLNWSANRSFR
jgi:putative transposase